MSEPAADEAQEARPTTGGRPRPGRLRRWVVRPLVWVLLIPLLLIAGLLFYLRTDAAAERARAFLVARLSDYLERPVMVGGVEWSFWPLSLEVRDLVIPGPEAEDRPVAIVPRGRLDVSLEGVRNPRLILERLWLERPELYLEVTEDGQTNLPELGRDRDSQARLEVEIGALVVEDGSFFLNEQRMPLEVDAEGILAQLAGSGSTLPLAGRVAVERLRATLPGGEPYPLKMVARVQIQSTEVEILSSELSGPDLEARWTGSYTWQGTEKRLRINAEGQGRAEVAERLGFNTGGLEGPVGFTARLDVNDGEWLLEADLASERLRVEEWEVRDLVTHLSGGVEGVEAEILQAALLGGSATGEVKVDLTAETARVEVEMELAALSAPATLERLSIPIQGIAGRVYGPVRYRFDTDAPLDGSGWANLEVREGQVRTGAATKQAIALEGDVPLTIENGRLTSDAIRLRSRNQDIRIQGLVVNLEEVNGELSFLVQTTDLGRLTLLLPPPEPGEAAQPWMPTQGQGLIEGRVLSYRPAEGQDMRVQTDVRMELEEVVAPGGLADRLRGSMAVSRGGIDALRLELERTSGARQGALLVTGHVPFEQSAGGTGLEITLDAVDWPIAEAQAFLPFELPADGPVTGRLDLFAQGEEIAGQVQLGMAPAALYGFEAQRLDVLMSFEPKGLRITESRLLFPAGEILAKGLVGFEGEGALELQVEAPEIDLAAEPLDGIFAGKLSGVVSAFATVSGSFEVPETEALITSRDLTIQGKQVGDSEARISWVDGQVQASGSLLGLLDIRGGGVLDLDRADVSLHLETDAIAELASLAMGEGILTPEQPLSGSLAGELTVQGSLREPEVRLTLGTVRLAYGQLSLSELEPARFRLDPEALVIESLYLGSRSSASSLDTSELATPESEIFLFGDVGLSEGAPIDLRFQASLPARWAEPFVAGARLRGDVDALGRVRGTAAAPRLDGQASWTSGDLILQGFPHPVTDIRSIVLVYPDRVVLDSFSGNVASGTLQAAGSTPLALGGSSGARNEDWRLQASVRDVRLRYPEGWVVRGGGDFVLLPQADGQVLRGAVTLDRASYVRDIRLNLFQLLSGFLRRQRLEVGVADPLLTSTQLNVVVSAPNSLRVRNNVADLSGSADFTVVGTLARPVIVGQVEVEEGGTMVYGETEYKIERGLLTFARLDRIDPIVDLTASSRVREYEIQLNLSGTLDRLNASFSSEPALPDLDVLALLSTGETLEGGGDLTSRVQGTSAGTGGGAEVFLYGQAASAVSSRVKSLFGLDKFRIDPTSSAGGSVDSARLIIGQQISRDLFVTYQRDVSANQEELVEAEWRIAPGLVLVLSVADGEQYGVELRWETRF